MSVQGIAQAQSAKKLDYQKFLAPAVLVIMYVFFAIFGNNFFSGYTAKTILESAYYTGLMSFGITFVIITGGIDLSIGTNMMCSAIIGGVAFSMWGWPLWLALCLVPLTGVIFGFINGILVSKAKLPPFIATLGMMLVTQGFGAIISRVQTQRYPTIGTANEWFKTVFYRTGNFPTGTLYLLAAFIVAAFVLNKTRFGRYVYAIGSNEEATRLSGVKVDKFKIMAYMVCGLFAGIGGILYAATYTTAIPGTGNGLETYAIAAVIIGGTSMAGGSGTMVGTLIGIFIMAVLKTGLASLGLQAHWQTFFTGIVVIGAVLMDNVRVRAAQKVKVKA
ncbi:MAG: ABC transporter permease [Clostridiales bacterium]|jgi:ribose transport system permease protein|nr:ABC transporter permease [Clostridiales bacterium]